MKKGERKERERGQAPFRPVVKLGRAEFMRVARVTLLLISSSSQLAWETVYMSTAMHKCKETIQVDYVVHRRTEFPELAGLWPDRWSGGRWAIRSKCSRV